MPSRRSLLAALGGTGLLGGGIAVSSQKRLDPIEAESPSVDTWPLDRYGPANSAGTTDAAIPMDPAIAWEKDTDTGGNYASVVVGPDIVYAGGDQVAALDREDGTVQWTRDIRGYTLGLWQGTLYIGPLFDNEPVGPMAVTARDGHQQWQADSEGEVSHLIVGGDTVLIGYFNDTLAAYDSESGSRRWSLTDTGHGSYPLIHDGTVYAATRKLVRYRQRTVLDSLLGSGPTPAWSIDFSMEPNPPTVNQNTVIYGGSNARDEPAIQAINRRDGSNEWEWEVAQSDKYRLAASTPAIVGNQGFTALRYGGNVDPHHHAVGAITLTDGSVDWHRRVEQRITDIVATADAAIIATAENPHSDPSAPGTIRALSSDDGNERWRVDVEDAVYSLAVVDGTLFAKAGTGRILALKE